jgi:hypothetical protein
LTGGREIEMIECQIAIAKSTNIALITDIDTPRGGLITMDDRPLRELNDSLK